MKNIQLTFSQKRSRRKLERNKHLWQKVEFLGIWEQLNNPDFKGVEFDSFLFEAGSNSFTLSPSKWMETTNAKGIVSRQGNNGGTFAHRDIKSIHE